MCVLSVHGLCTIPAIFRIVQQSAIMKFWYNGNHCWIAQRKYTSFDSIPFFSLLFWWLRYYKVAANGTVVWFQVGSIRLQFYISFPFIKIQKISLLFCTHFLLVVIAIDCNHVVLWLLLIMSWPFFWFRLKLDILSQSYVFSSPFSFI